jgi:capsular polysaccharide transport system permease protein
MKQRPAGFIPMAQRPTPFSLPWRTARTVGALMLREMTTTYGRSPGGYLWAFLEPVGSIAMLTLVISSGLKLTQPSLGISFAMFYATGMLVFTLYVRLQQKVAQSIVYSRSLLLYPSVKFFDTIVARSLLNLITQGAVMAVVFAGIIMAFETRTNLDLRWILASVAMAAALGVGVGVLNAFLMPLFPIYASVFGILTTPLFFTSGVLYTYEELPPFAQSIMWYNPLVHVTAMMRRGFYSQYEGEFIDVVYVLSFAALFGLIGFILVSRYFRIIVDRSF